MNEDILVGQVEEVTISPSRAFERYGISARISSRWYSVRDPREMDRVLLADNNVLVCTEELVASDDFTELVPV